MIKHYEVPPGFFGMFLQDVILNREDSKNYIFKVKEVKRLSDDGVLSVKLDTGSEFRVVVTPKR